MHIQTYLGWLYYLFRRGGMTLTASYLPLVGGLWGILAYLGLCVSEKSGAVILIEIRAKTPQCQIFFFRSLFDYFMDTFADRAALSFSSRGPAKFRNELLLSFVVSPNH